MGVVYKLTFPNGKAYIGITVRPMETRWLQHVRCSKNKKYQQPVHRAINKYKPENVKISLLHSGVEGTLLQSLEIEEIKAAKDSGQILYNMTVGGEGVIGYVHTNEDKAKISASLLGNQRTKGRVWSDKERQNRAENRVPISESTRQKLRDALKARPVRKGFQHSEKVRKAMSDGRTGSKNARAILDESSVSKIKLLICQDYMLKDIAELFGVSSGIISRICTDRAWSHVPWPLDNQFRED